MLAATALFGVFTSPAAATTAPDTFGVNPGDLFGLPQAEWDTHLTAMSITGIETVRMGAWWADLEPAAPVAGRHTFAWAETDLRVAAMAKRGLRWAPLLAFSPAWAARAGGGEVPVPARAEDFAQFAAALARRYGTGGTFWSERSELPALPITAYEIWNEPNASRFWPEGDARSYADLYAASRIAIRAVDTSARVIVGGLAANAAGVVPAGDFVAGMLASRPEMRGAVDGVGFHPYARDTAGVYATLAAFRRRLDATAGAGIPLELTEIGWTTTDVSEDERARMLGELALTLPSSDCGVASVAPYSWVGPEQDAADREQWFGLLNTDRTAKTSLHAYARSVWIMRGFAGIAPPTPKAICAAPEASAASTAARPTARKLRLQLLLRQDPARPDRLVVSTRCGVRCALRVEMLEPVRAMQAAHHAPGYRSRRSVTLSLGDYAPGSRVKVKVTATTRDGRETRVFKTLGLR